jgi:hypothetical protein
LIVKNKAGGTRDKLVWKWIRGANTTTLDFANPQSTADYALCIYAGIGNALVAQIHVPASPNWIVDGQKWKYRDPAASADGTQKITLKASSDGKSRATLKAKGINLPDPLDANPLGTPVTVQLVNYETGVCVEGNYTTATKDTQTSFIAKQ